MAAKKIAAKAVGKKAPPKPAGKPSESAEPSAPKRVPPKAATSLPTKAAPAATVTLRHLAAELTERHEMPKKQADGLLTDIVAMLVEHLKGGDRLRIGGLGILEVKNRPARMGRNPATGEVIPLKASKKIAFRAAKELKEAI